MPTETTISLSPIAMFIAADPVVKVVMLALIAASVWTWITIVASSLRISRVRRDTREFERTFRMADDVDAFHESVRDQDHPAARILSTGLVEWRETTAAEDVDLAGARERISVTLGSAVAHEIDELSDRLNGLATVGSVAPFVGLFGTVWGIMRSFTGIAQAQNTSLGVVAPGIAEALFATALGLFAAIPAVVAYNRFSHRVNRVEAHLSRFADSFHTMLSRRLERKR